MATDSSILAMDRGAWQAEVYGVTKELDITEGLNKKNLHPCRGEADSLRTGRQGSWDLTNIYQRREDLVLLRAYQAGLTTRRKSVLWQIFTHSWEQPGLGLEGVSSETEDND